MTGRIRLLVASVTQTGDIAHIAGALALSSDINALILHDANVDVTLLRALYQRAATTNERVDFLPISPSQVQEPQKKLYNALRFCDNLREPGPAKIKTFKDVLGDVAYAAFTAKYSVPVSDTKPRAKFVVMKLTETTGEIAKAFTKDKLGSYKLAAQRIILDPVQLPINDIISPVGKFGNITLPPADRTVLLVWARYTGTKTDIGFNPEGDSDPTGQNQLVASGTKSGFTVITIGDVPLPEMTNVVNNATCQLGEFWTQNVQWKSRAAQCSFFAALMQRYSGNLYQIGQKTGAMDFPALLGVPTIYIEDSQIPTTATVRMRKWAKHLQLYRRLEVEDPPSLPGKGARMFTGTFNFEAEASDERRRIGEAKWRMAGLLLGLRGKWTNITNLPTEPLTISDIYTAVTEATPQTLQAWTTNINALSDNDCQSESFIRGYTAKDLTKVEAELTALKAEYSKPTMIIRKSNGTYAYRGS